MAEFKQRTRLSDTREALLAAVTPRNRTVRRPLTEADGRALTKDTVTPAGVPGYDRTAMDGYAVRAPSTFGASDRSPNVLRIVDDPVGLGTTAHIHTGNDVPEGAGAVVMVRHTECLGDELEVFDMLVEGENIGERGEDVREGTPLFEADHELRPSNIDPLRSVDVEEVTLFERLRVSVVPTGEELVESDPGPDEIIETNGLTVSRLVERWDDETSYRDIVVNDADLLHEAVESDLDHDVVVTTGGSSANERNLIPEVIDDIGEVLVHGVALKPGHPVTVGAVEGTSIVMFPGYPVACVVNAFQFLRPVPKHVGSLPERPLSTREAALTRKLPSSPGTRTFAHVKLDLSGDESTAEPARTSRSDILSSVALANGWVTVPKGIESYDGSDTVAVEDREWSA